MATGFQIYREAYDMFVFNGILFGNESPLKGLEYGTRKVTNAVARIKLGLQNALELRNLNAIQEWGYEQYYVEVMWKMSQLPEQDDFVIAIGKGHFVKN